MKGAILRCLLRRVKSFVLRLAALHCGEACLTFPAPIDLRLRRIGRRSLPVDASFMSPRKR